MVSNGPTTLHVGESLEFDPQVCLHSAECCQHHQRGMNQHSGGWSRTTGQPALQFSCFWPPAEMCVLERGNLPASGALDLAFQTKCTKTRWHAKSPAVISRAIICRCAIVGERVILWHQIKPSWADYRFEAIQQFGKGKVWQSVRISLCVTPWLFLKCILSL